jgi:hypothetical protein
MRLLVYVRPWVVRQSVAIPKAPEDWRSPKPGGMRDALKPGFSHSFEHDILGTCNLIARHGRMRLYTN